MFRALLALGAGGLMLAALGCAICASPFDDCGPTYTDGQPDRRGSNGRAGSILSGGAPVMEQPLDAAPTLAPVPVEPPAAPAPPPPLARPGQANGWKASAAPAPTPSPSDRR